jgi:hypothetical protein
MNEIELQNLMLISQRYKNIHMTIGLFCDLLRFSHKEFAAVFVAITDEMILQTGLYAKLHDANLWVSPVMAPGCISVSDLEVVDPRTKEHWSVSVPLIFADADKLDRIFALKAFW